MTELENADKKLKKQKKLKVMSLDLETYSDVNLGKCGVYKYCESDNFHILLFAYAFDDEPVQIIDLACGEQLPQEVVDAIFDEHIIKAAWNAQFERTCLSKYFGIQLSPDSWRCSMVHSASLSLPLKLKTAAEVLKVSEQKDSAGERLIKYFSMPCKPTKKNGGRTRNLPEDEDKPGDWQKFKDYCVQDVRTERAIRKNLERFPLLGHEWDYYHMDQRINDRGVLIDTELVAQAMKCDQIQSEAMLHKAYELTGLENPNSISQLKSWLEERGISVATLGKKDVASMITDLDKHSTDQEALDMLKLRLQMAKSSIKKYQAAERCVCADGRARGLFQFSGANRTARWAGRFIQLHNLVRNDLTTLDEARELIKMGCFDMVASIYGNVPDVLSQLIRTMLIPKPGCEFIVADFSAIEARVLAHLAGEQWRLDAFKRGEDIYCASASAMFGVPVVKHGINGELRNKGKIAELACIAEGQLVLTDHGLIPIEKVTIDMKLWDGEEWVSHDGVVYKGVQYVIKYDGLTATPDHLVYVDKNKEPVHFREIAIPDTMNNTKNNTNSIGQMPVYDIMNAGRHHRFTVSGKLVHNCGYQGGTGALIAMGALDMGLKEDDLPKLIEDWRSANPNIVKFWWDLEKAAIDTTRDHQDRTAGKIDIQFHANTLWLVLPSGRKLAYINPKLQPNRFGRMSLTYEGLNAANKWDRIESYGGKLAENCIAEGTLVMTKCGLIPIENVKLSDQVWDGIEWVYHEGIVNQGWKDTVSVCSVGSDSCSDNCSNGGSNVELRGICMTPNHRILTEEYGWRECGNLSHSYDGRVHWKPVKLPEEFSGCERFERFEACKENIMDCNCLTDRIFISSRKERAIVYDIKNCGPRHRFAVWDSGAKCLRLVSNCTQATARDLLAEAMWRIEQAGLDIVLHIHDEAVLEVPMNTISVDDVCKIMNQNPDWAEGLPLASAGYSGHYYFKD